MIKNKENNNKSITFTLPKDERDELIRRARKASYISMSKFIRDSLMGDKTTMVVAAKNKYADELTELIKKAIGECRRVGNNYNQSVAAINKMSKTMDMEGMKDENDRTVYLLRIQTSLGKMNEQIKMFYSEIKTLCEYAELLEDWITG